MPYTAPSLEEWADDGGGRANIADLRSEQWRSAILDHHVDQVRADLASAGEVPTRSVLTLYLHIIGQVMAYMGAGEVPDDQLLGPPLHDTGLDWFTLRTAAVCQLAIAEQIIPETP